MKHWIFALVAAGGLAFTASADAGGCGRSYYSGYHGGHGHYGGHGSYGHRSHYGGGGYYGGHGHGYYPSRSSYYRSYYPSYNSYYRGGQGGFGVQTRGFYLNFY